MNWTERKPEAPGLYWYRSQQTTLPRDFETLKIVWDESAEAWLAQTHDRGSIAVASCTGEWYGPIAPPATGSEAAFAADHGRNARIAVRLLHGGSFYVENTLPDAVAVALSKKLKALHKKGSSIPANLRGKITGLLRELIKFAEASPDRDRTLPLEP